MSDLKCCPFCETDQVFLRSHGLWWFVDCDSCAAMGPLVFNDHERAAGLWNAAHRVAHLTQEPPMGEIECQGPLL